MKHYWVGLILLSTACGPVIALNQSLHPSPDGSASGAGISMGGIYGTLSDDTSVRDGDHLTQIPYGEGWARFGAGVGQLELRVTPMLSFVSYRANLMPEESEIGLAIQPSLGFMLTVTGDDNDSGGILTLAPNVAFILSLADGQFFVAPRVGYIALIPTEAGDSTGLFAIAANVGYIIEGDPFHISLEMSFQRVSSTEEHAEGVYYIVGPAIGLQI